MSFILLLTSFCANRPQTSPFELLSWGWSKFWEYLGRSRASRLLGTSLRRRSLANNTQTTTLLLLSCRALTQLLSSSKCHNSSIVTPRVDINFFLGENIALNLLACSVHSGNVEPSSSSAALHAHFILLSAFGADYIIP
jgi:hypothetical protein